MTCITYDNDNKLALEFILPSYYSESILKYKIKITHATTLTKVKSIK